MKESDYFKWIEEKGYVEAGSDAHRLMYQLSTNAQRITMDINAMYHTHDELVELFSQLNGETIDPSFGLFPPFYTDCGKNIHVGKNVFIKLIMSFSRSRWH